MYLAERLRLFSDVRRCPFVIASPGGVSYVPINVPQGGDAPHNGARVNFVNAEEISIYFLVVSTYLTSK